MIRDMQIMTSKKTTNKKFYFKVIIWKDVWCMYVCGSVYAWESDCYCHVIIVCSLKRRELCWVREAKQHLSHFISRASSVTVKEHAVHVSPGRWHRYIHKQTHRCTQTNTHAQSILALNIPIIQYRTSMIFQLDLDPIHTPPCWQRDTAQYLWPFLFVTILP